MPSPTPCPTPAPRPVSTQPTTGNSQGRGPAATQRKKSLGGLDFAAQKAMLQPRENRCASPIQRKPVSGQEPPAAVEAAPTT